MGTRKSSFAEFHKKVKDLLDEVKFDRWEKARKEWPSLFKDLQECLHLTDLTCKTIKRKKWPETSKQ